MTSKATLGADPEFFIRDRQTGVPHPICGLLGGTKGNPFMHGVYGVQEDNVMAEYNIPPTADPMRFSRAVIAGRKAVLEVLESNHPGRYEADLAPARLFSHELLAVPQAQQFGCSPDFDAYQMGSPNRRIMPDELLDDRGGWRFSGGHVHIGYAAVQQFEIPAYVAAQFADCFIGLPTLKYDLQGQRRRFYGTAGRYRPTPYGIEYRTLSNMWTYDAGTAESVGYFASALGGFLSRKEGELKRIWSEIPWMDVKRAIEVEDLALSTTLISYCQGLGLEI